VQGHGADGRKPEGMLPATHHRKRYEFAQAVFQNFSTWLTKCRFVMPCYEYGIGSGKDINLFPRPKSRVRYVSNKPAISVHISRLLKNTLFHVN
jgi:hypothetical protein